VIQRDNLTLKALDHGFYYGDIDLPVIVAPVVNVGREWRYVVVQDEVVAGSAYEADGRTAIPDDPSGTHWEFAQSIAKEMAPPQDVFVMDICEVDERLRLLELNPFSGADLYAYDVNKVVEAVSRLAIL
jgi:hypothetical protein